MREYEFTVIARADLPDAERAKVFEKYEKLFLADGGEMIKKDDWGSKKLSYPINEQFRGHYVFYDFVGHSKHLAEVERLMRIDESILRYMSIKLGENVDPDERREELAKLAAQKNKHEDHDNLN